MATLLYMIFICILPLLPPANAEQEVLKETNYGTVIGIDLGTTYS